MEIGAKEPDEIVIERLKPQRPNHCCELIYTVSPFKSFFLSVEYYWFSIFSDLLKFNYKKSLF